MVVNKLPSPSHGFPSLSTSAALLLVRHGRATYIVAHDYEKSRERPSSPRGNLTEGVARERLLIDGNWKGDPAFLTMEVCERRLMVHIWKYVLVYAVTGISPQHFHIKSLFPSAIVNPR